MQIIQAIFLGLIQGLTEFIPVSSSGHLVIAEKLIHLPINGFAYDAVLNLGTLAALISYFRHDLLNLLKGLTNAGRQRHLAGLIIIATIPAIIGGLMLESFSQTSLRSLPIVAGGLITVALAMLLIEQRATQQRSLDQLQIKDAVIIGLAQVLAFVPGVSRSAATITAGLNRNLKRQVAARFSFLLSIPVLGGGTLKVLLEKETLSQITAQPTLYFLGTITAFISGYGAVAFLLRYLKHHSLNIFAYYRLGLAAIILLIYLVK